MKKHIMKFLKKVQKQGKNMIESMIKKRIELLLNRIEELANLAATEEVQFSASVKVKDIVNKFELSEDVLAEYRSIIYKIRFYEMLAPSL